MRTEIPGSFRDPAGFLFRENGVLLRQVDERYAESYRRLVESGLAGLLQARGLLIPHAERDPGPYRAGGAPVHAVLEPEPVGLITYPFEWSFSQLRDAALCTLAVQQTALEHGMSLKDASAYNIQFHRGKPVLIDTLSFEPYAEGRPWVAYRQFCQHFLAPLCLQAFADARLARLAVPFLDGTPLDLASSLLPFRSWLKLPVLAHVHLHARSQRRHAGDGRAAGRGGFNRLAFRALLDSLEGLVRGLAWKPAGTEWGDYYAGTNYTPEAFAAKEELVERLLRAAGGARVTDFGANDGRFSRKAAALGAHVAACDIDPAAVEKNYLGVKRDGETRVLPLVIDLANPSPAIGWENRERESFLERSRADTGLALALVHHLSISNNLPLPRIARFFAEACGTLLIEFVPKEDSQVRRMLATREDIFDGYGQDGFEAAFAGHFRMEAREPVPGTARTLYLFRKPGP